MKRKIFKIFITIVCAVILVALLAGVIYVHSIKNNEKYSKLDHDKFTKVHSNLTVLDANGNVLQEAMYYKNIKQIPLGGLPKHTYMAFVSVEDKRFFSHNGIDAKRVLGALVHNVKSGTIKEGASTISQQLIKNTHLDNSKNIQRKVNEMLLATELERIYSKEEILEMYLNTIYFGRNAYGIENASNAYFGKSASQLTISESAVLAGMIKAPNVYAPDKNMEKCRARRNIVLDLMLEQSIITEEQYQAAKASEICYLPQNKLMEKTYMYYALKEACQLLNMTECQLLNTNYTIETFCDQTIQQQLCNLAREDKTTDKHGNLTNLACVLTDNFGNVTACYMRGEQADTKGQVGSALKPIAVYAPALDKKIITQASPVLDEATNFNGYAPKNVNGYHGWTTIKQAVTKSLNIPAVKTLNSLTLSTAENYLAKLGFEGEQNLSLALGNIEGGVTPFELAKCYTSLANNGSAGQTKFVKSITSDKGTIYTASNQTTQVYSQTASYLMTDMLVDVVNNGTAKALKKHYQVAGKTGTVGSSNGNSDAVIAGYTSSHTFVIWHRGDLPNSVSGSQAPCTLASNLLEEIYQSNHPKDFVPPKSVVKLTVDKNTLENQQQLLLSQKGLDFWFDVSNKPYEKLKETVYNQVITTTKHKNGLNLTLPYVANGKWELCQEVDGQVQTVPLCDNEYYCQGTERCAFYANLYVDEKLVYTTPMVEIFPEQTNVKHNKKSLLDFWYWK